MKRRGSFNYAKLTKDEINNLKIRSQVINAKEAEKHELLAVLAMLKDGDNAYKREIIAKYKLRESKKGYVFDFEHGYVHRPNSKPWETRPAPSDNPLSSTGGAATQEEAECTP